MLVAVADPTNVVFSDELRLALGMPVRLCVAAPESIEAGDQPAPRGARPSRSRRSSRTRRRARTTRPCSTSTTTRRPSCSSTGSSRRRSISAPRTSTSRRSNAASTCGSASTASCASSPRSPGSQASRSRAASRSWAASTSPSGACRRTAASRSNAADGVIDVRIAVLPTTPRREGHAADPLPGRGARLARRARHVAPQPRGPRARDHAAVRRRRRRRPDRLGQDDDALRLPSGAEHLRPSAHDDRGPGRVPGRRARPDRGEPAGRASPSRTACARSCAPIPTCSSSARSATRRPRRSRSGRR